ncbi:hypothetical protein ACFLX5_02795, partial [Chloroflexota bacterium]
MGNCRPAMNEEARDKYSFETGPIRPPSEGQDRSLLIRATRNCPWNRCEFCTTYKGERFGYRGVEEIKRDIDVARSLADEIKTASLRLGCGAGATREAVGILLRERPEVYGHGLVDDGLYGARLHCLINVANWLGSGARTAFLQDADSLIMRTPELSEVIRYLVETFPTIERVTSYARARTASKKSAGETEELRRAGLSRLHVGLESGCDEVLAYTQKGVTAEEHIRGGRRIVEAGMELSEYVMPGLGGRRWSEAHARDSARVLSQIGPAFIRLRSLIVPPHGPLHERLDSGDFVPLTEDEVVAEIGVFVENLDCNAYLASDQMSNLLGEIEGQLPEDKGAILDTIAGYREMPLEERLSFRLKRRLNAYIAVNGGLAKDLAETVKAAFESIQEGSPDAGARVDGAIAALKMG